MKLVHYNPGELPYEAVHSFVMDYAVAYPMVFGELDVEDRAKKLQANAHTFAFVDDVGRIAAALFFYCNDMINHVAFITSIARLPDAHHVAGSELMRVYESFVKQVGMKRSRLEVSKENTAAQTFYLRQGYTKKSSGGTDFVFEKEI